MHQCSFEQSPVYFINHLSNSNKTLHHHVAFSLGDVWFSFNTFKFWCMHLNDFLKIFICGASDVKMSAFLTHHVRRKKLSFCLLFFIIHIKHCNLTCTCVMHCSAVQGSTWTLIFDHFCPKTRGYVYIHVNKLSIMLTKCTVQWHTNLAIQRFRFCSCVDCATALTSA